MPHSLSDPDRLIDRFGRHINYVRISVTDRCDFRCVYCMEPDQQFVPRARILTLEEIANIGRAFVQLGVKKIRITGGEPLVRRNVLKLLNDLSALPGLRELVMTTNGSQLRRLAPAVRDAGVKRLNISLDSLNAARFRRMTRSGDLRGVLEGIDTALNAGFERLKLNTVILRGENDDEIIPLVRYAGERGMDISFIEEMPLGIIADHEREKTYYSSDEIRTAIGNEYTLIPTTESTGGPSKYYRLEAFGTRVGFISPHSQNFCDDCNRVRLTVEGRLLLCLGQEHAIDLRAVVRRHPGDFPALKAAIRAGMDKKPHGHEFDLSAKPLIFRHMNQTGG